MSLLSTSDVILQARESADAMTPNPATDFVTDDELLKVLARAHKKLYSAVIDMDGGMFLYATSTVLTSPYALPVDFYRFVSAEVPDNGGSENPWRELKQFPWAERNRYTDRENPRVRVIGKSVVFAPSTASPTQLQLWYIPVPPSLADITEAGTVDAPVEGWEDFLVYTLAAYICRKEDRDESLHQSSRGEALQVIQRAVKALDYAEARTVADVQVLPADYDDFAPWR